MTTFFYTIREIPGSHSSFQVDADLNYTEDELDALVLRAVNLYFFAERGWECEYGWPLTFTLLDSHNKEICSRFAFLLDGSNPPTVDLWPA